mmetsp:Transcript_2475/g.3825  ORF Transcript_2475/g.3825 Transcript_2475/m.3825 type:complete len:80 (+) Transcript_2475:56-295(+)
MGNQLGGLLSQFDNKTKFTTYVSKGRKLAGNIIWCSVIFGLVIVLPISMEFEFECAESIRQKDAVTLQNLQAGVGMAQQ